MKQLTAVEKEQAREVAKMLREKYPDLVDGGAQMLSELYVADCEGFTEFLREQMGKKDIVVLHEDDSTAPDQLGCHDG